MITHEITNSDDYIDSRTVIARIRDLESTWRDDSACTLQEGDSVAACCHDLTPEAYLESGIPFATDRSVGTPCVTCGCTFDQADAEELAALRELAAECEHNISEWEYGATLIRDSYFEDYAQELAEDIGAIGSNMQWPLMYIDWNAAAEALKQDYSSVDFDGVEYWGRS